MVLPYLPLKSSQFLNSFVFIILVSFTMLLKCILILCCSWVPIYYVSHCFIKFFTKYSLCQNLLAPAVCLYLVIGTRFCATAMRIQLFSSRLQVSTKPIIFPQLSFLLQCGIVYVSFNSELHLGAFSYLWFIFPCSWSLDSWLLFNYDQ